MLEDLKNEDAAFFATVGSFAGVVILPVVAAVLVYFVVQLLQEPGTNQSSESYVVVDVVDGDTINVTDPAGASARVRILGIDTPEHDECGGPEATAQAHSLLHPGQQITLTRDDSQPPTDKYGRVLAYVQLEDGTDVGRWLIEAGYAQELTIGAKHDRAQQYALAEDQARSEKRGTWAFCAPW